MEGGMFYRLTAARPGGVFHPSWMQLVSHAYADRRMFATDWSFHILSTMGLEDQWIDNSGTADRDPTPTVDKNGQRRFSQMARINKRPTTSITAHVTP